MLVLIESMGAILVYNCCIWSENCNNTQTRMHYYNYHPTSLPHYGGGVATDAGNVPDKIWMFLIHAPIPIIDLSRRHCGDRER